MLAVLLSTLDYFAELTTLGRVAFVTLAAFCSRHHTRARHLKRGVKDEVGQS